MVFIVGVFQPLEYEKLVQKNGFSCLLKPYRTPQDKYYAVSFVNMHLFSFIILITFKYLFLEFQQTLGNAMVDEMKQTITWKTE